MSTIPSTQDVNDQIDILLKRISLMEQTITDPNHLNSGATVITVDGSLLVMQVTPAVPTGITLTPGAFMNNVYVDVSWTPPADSTATAYEVELAKKVSGVYQTMDAKRTNGNSIRWNGLEPATTYGFRIASVSNSQAISSYVPAVGFSDVTTGADATVPAQVTGLQVFAGLRTLVARWNDNAEIDVAHGAGVYAVDCAIDAGFVTIIHTNFQGGNVTTFSDLNPNATYYLRVAAIDTSGNQGPYSTTQNGTTGQANHNDIGPGIITADLIAAATIIGGNIAASTITGNLIAANTIDAHSIKTSLLDVANITLSGGSLIAGTPPTTGLVMNSQGLRLYSGGIAQVILDVSGSATFQGTINASSIIGSAITGGAITGGTITGTAIRSSSTNPKVEIDATTYGTTPYHRIAFYSNNTLSGYTPSTIFALGTGTAEALLINAGYIAPNASFAGTIGLQTQSGAGWIYLSVGGISLHLDSGSHTNVNGSTNIISSYAPLYSDHFFSSDSSTVKFFDLNNVYSAFNPSLFSAATGTHALALQGGVSSNAVVCSWNAAGNDGGPARWEANNNNMSGLITIYASAFTVGSARATKKNIVELHPSLHDKLDLVLPRSYARKAVDWPLPVSSEPGESPIQPFNGPNNTERHIYTDNNVEWGFVADELVKVYPEMVDTINGMPFAINYTMLIPVLVNAIKDLRSRVKQLEGV